MIHEFILKVVLAPEMIICLGFLHNSLFVPIF